MAPASTRQTAQKAQDAISHAEFEATIASLNNAISTTNQQVESLAKTIRDYVFETRRQIEETNNRLEKKSEPKYNLIVSIVTGLAGFVFIIVGGAWALNANQQAFAAAISKAEDNRLEQMILEREKKPDRWTYEMEIDQQGKVELRNKEQDDDIDSVKETLLRHEGRMSPLEAAMKNLGEDVDQIAFPK